MKNILFAVFVFCWMVPFFSGAQSSIDHPLTKMNTRLASGWNTWDTRSVLSQVLLPKSFGISLQLLHHQSGDTLHEALIGREGFGTKEHVVPGPHAYDGSYTELTLEWRGIRIRVQTAAKGEKFCLLLTPIRQTPGDSVLIQPKMFWNREGKITVTNKTITATTPSGTVQLYSATATVLSGKNFLKTALDKSTALSSDASMTAAEVAGIIATAREKFVAGRNRYKESAELYNAMQTALSWNVIYEPTQDRVITPVSRLWNVSWRGWVLFEWDTYFAAYMMSLDNKELAYANTIAMTRDITENGFVPNGSSFDYKSEDRSEPPVGALIAKEIYKKYGEKWFLSEIFDGLLRWNRWWSEKRDVNGYLCWGSDPYKPGKILPFLLKGIGTKKGAQWESGLDNSPMWDDAVFDTVTHRMLLADVGLMSLYITDCRSLAEIASVLGKTTIAAELNSRAEKYAQKLETLWDDQFGLYLNKDLVTGKLSRRLSPTLFYPLLAKVPSQQKAERMMKEHFYNPNEFWGDYIMPSIARNDIAYKDNKYWRGRIWAPMNFLVYLGIRNYNLPDARNSMVEKSKKLLLQSWIDENHVYENYNADTGLGNDSGMSDAFYHWGALLGFIDLVEKKYVPSPETKAGSK